MEEWRLVFLHIVDGYLRRQNIYESLDCALKPLSICQLAEGFPFVDVN